MSQPKLYRRTDAAAYVREVHHVPCAETTLAKMATVGGGPEITYAGRWPLYSEQAIDAWVAAKMANTPDSAGRPYRKPAVKNRGAATKGFRSFCCSVDEIEAVAAAIYAVHDFKKPWDQAGSWKAICRREALAALKASHKFKKGGRK